jgi:hypothetical protein
MAKKAEALLSGDSANIAASELCIAQIERLWGYMSGDEQAALSPELTKKKRLLATIDRNLSVGPDSPVAIVDATLSRVGELVLRAGGDIDTWLPAN